MAEYPKHARYARQADFDKQLSGGLIDGGTICFIEDTRQIYVNGNYYTMDDSELAEKLSGYATKEELGTKQDAFDVGYGLALEDSVLKVTIDPSLFVVCPDGLPSKPAEGEEDKIHLVPMEETEEGNAYEEWLWVNGSWELFGTLHTKVDLEDYYTKGETDAKLELYLPLKGGTLTGNLAVTGYLSGSTASFSGISCQQLDVDHENGITNKGQTTLALTEKDDAENVVVADSAGKLYSMPVSALSGGSSGTSGHTGACDGVYVAYVDYDGVRRICTASEWSDSLGAAQGVMVGDGTHELLLAPTQASSTQLWASKDELIGGIITTTSSSNAQKDFNGRLNSEGIAAMGGDYLSDSYAPGFCRSYAHGAVPAGDWWLPSAGELYLIYTHYSDIVTALSAIGATALSNYYWSSTQYSSGDAWDVAMRNGDMYYDYKHYDFNSVRAVAAFDYEL